MPVVSEISHHAFSFDAHVQGVRLAPGAVDHLVLHLDQQRVVVGRPAAQDTRIFSLNLRTPRVKFAL